RLRWPDRKGHAQFQIGRREGTGPERSGEMSNEKMEIEITLAPAKGRRGGRKPSSKVAEQRRIPRFTRLMALAIKFQDMIDRGEVRDQADIARLGYVTRARITQIMNLLNLASGIQEDILVASGSLAGREAATERQIRSITKFVLWADQIRAWTACSHQYKSSIV